MNTSPTSSAVRTQAPDPLNELPQEIWIRLVVNHISLHEGRAITSLACVNRLFAQWLAPYRKPVALYRALETASYGTPAHVLYRCMSTLYDLADVNPAHRLELFLRVSIVLGRHFHGRAIEPHIDTLLASIQHLPAADQPAALLDLAWHHGARQLYTTQPHYLKMASRIGALPPSAAQASLAEALGSHIPDGGAEHYVKRTQIFLDICMRLQPVHRAQVLSHLLGIADTYPKAISAPDNGNPADREEQRNPEVLLLGLHQCLQSMPLTALPLDQHILLLGRATIMPAMLADTDEADRMAGSLLRMTQAEGGDAYWSRSQHGEGRLDERINHMLQKVFERGSQQSIHRFERLYQAMAHLPPTIQVRWMQTILSRCDYQADPGVTPALIVATAQAARDFPQDQLKRIYDLLAICLTPGPLRSAASYPCLQPARIDSLEQSGYLHRFEVNCGHLMHSLRNTAPDVACKLLVGINGVYARDRPLDDILPASSHFTVLLYGHFLKQALGFLESVPPANAADCLLQWEMPRRYGPDARSIDNQTISLLTALQKIGDKNSLVSKEQLEATLSSLMKDAVSVSDHSPMRNRRLLTAVRTFPASVYADVLHHLLEMMRNPGLAHADVLFSSVVEAAGALPDALLTKVLKTAAYQLRHFPEYRTYHPADPATLRKYRETQFEKKYPGLQASDPELHDYVQPGCVTRVQGFGQLLEVMRALPPRHQAEVLSILCNEDNFFRFSNGFLSDEEALECSMRLLALIISLTDEMPVNRGKVFSDWLDHFASTFQGRHHAPAENRLLATLFALPAKDGEPMFRAYLATITYAPEKAALQERARLHWKTT
ncbi:MAG TPA: hypothetical protein VF797_07915 [Noviherbaspirillum sp.]